MISLAKSLLILSVVVFSAAGVEQVAGPRTFHPEYTNEGKLRMPENYRSWIYLSSGFDMSYREGAPADHHMFDNVFVDPASYDVFTKTGKWPDRTTFVLENREGQTRGSINKKGQFQGDVMGLEVHIKDEKRFAGQWGFFGFEDGKPATMIPATETCYSCHSAHGAVDTTFTQFYPTLLPVAKAMKTLSASYLRDESSPKE